MPPPAIRTGHLDVYLLGRLAGRLDALADRIVPAVKALRAECAALHPSPVFGKIEGVVEQQAARLATRS